MKREKVSFKNREGLELSARLELPDNQKAHSYALFAHCFTCNKNLNAVRTISRALNKYGIAVLRFDFTGLGESEGDFASTTFSSNVEDLVAAAEYLAEHYMAPSLIVGHSLGGAASISAASQIESVKAVCTIGAPASPVHVSHLFQDKIEELQSEGSAEITVGGRPFRLKKTFLDDLEKRDLSVVLKGMRKPILVIHSPQDQTVEIENAKLIYHNAHHPKSFISIDGADHLLSSRKDAEYVGNVVAGWAERYLDLPEQELLKSKHQVVARITDDGFTTDIQTGKHSLVADEPISIGGDDFGPAPYELVSSGLAACTAMTLKMYANRKEWPLEKVIVHVNHAKEEVVEEGESRKVDVFTRLIEISGDLDDKQRKRMLQIADKCPVHRTLESQNIIRTEEISS